MFRFYSALCAGALCACACSTIAAQSPATPDTARKLETVKITAMHEESHLTMIQALTLPAISSITATQIQKAVNVLDAEDAVKYMPSVFLRKRNNGDTQATMGTRVWGVSSSARSLIFADGVPLTALIANNNTIGGPRWGLVSPIEISRIDMMYGPYSAAYAGNSMGAVMEITTRMPDKLEGTLSQTQAMQSFSLYGTNKKYNTTQTNLDVGDRFGRAAFWLSGNYQDSHSQPLAYVTSGSFPAGTGGGYFEHNKLGATANVLGANGLLHTQMANAKLKASYDVTNWMRAAYSFGFWQNDANSAAQTYMTGAGNPTFAGQSGFASGTNTLLQQHSSHALSVRTMDPKMNWHFDVAATLYHFDKDEQRTPTSASSSDTTFGAAGRIAVLTGSGWNTLDLKGSWHQGGMAARHTVSAGVHRDAYELRNPTFNTADWKAGARGTVATEGDGKTQTLALWAQEAWTIMPTLRLTVGGRLESWRGFDGYNKSGTTAVTQPTVTSSKFSPKGIVAWDFAPLWTLTGSVGKAYRFPTTAELYQLVSTGATFTSPSPDLKPDNVLATELRLTRQYVSGSAQVALFQDDVHDAIISQFLPLVTGSPTLYSYVSNVDHVRARGVEVVLQGKDLFVPGLELQGSATYLDARTLALSGSASATAPAGSAVGKFLPNIPKWRGTVSASYTPIAKLSLSVAGRYSDKLYTTLDNADRNPNTYQGFSQWFVMDAKASYRYDRRISASLGVDNMLNRKYFLFHPFPQRTLVANVKVGL